jgi:hypothetical protein
MGASIRAAALPFVLATLGACGGGGGGGGVIEPTPTPSTPSPAAQTPSSTRDVSLASFPAVAPNQTVVMEGTSAAMSGTQIVTGDTAIITSANRSPIGDATVKFSYDDARALSGITVTTPQASFSFDRNAPGHSVSCNGGICSAEKPTTEAMAMDPFVVGWNYQSFGVWGTNLDSPSWQLGAVSAGTPTSGSSLPTTGTATFSGLAAGFYTDPAGTPFGTSANMRADVNFGSRNIGFSTSNTQLKNTNTNVRSTDTGLNLSGSLSYAPGVNAFSGTVQTQNTLLGGQAGGRFYGPAAEEIGGVYSLQGAGVSRMLGGFGGKR